MLRVRLHQAFEEAGGVVEEANIARMDLERQQGILDRLVKAEACNHCPEVSTSTHKSGHHSELLPVPSPWLGLHVNLFLLRFKYPYDCKMLPSYDKGS